MNANGLDMRNRREGLNDMFQSARREHQRITTRQDDFADGGMRPNPVKRSFELFICQKATIGANMLPSETETAVKWADQQGLQKRTIFVTMYDPFDGGQRIIPNRINGFIGLRGQFPDVRDDLLSDRVV